MDSSMEVHFAVNVTLLADNGTNVTDLTSESATGASIASPIVMFLAGLVGNMLALMVLHKSKTEIRSVMFYTLVAALTWNDLVGICLTSPPVLAAYLNQRHMPALDTLCRFHALAMVCFGLSTPFIVCTMAIERSLALKCAYFYSKYCTPTAARIVVALLWAFVLFFGSLPLFNIGSFSLQYPQTWCFLDFHSTLPLDKAYAYSYAVINLVVVAVMIVCNALVMTTLCQVRKTRKMSNASVNSTLLNVDTVEEKVRAPQHVRRRHHRDVELQMIWLLCAITTIFSVCWVPLMAYIIFCLQSSDNHSPVFGLIAVRMASLNQTINPWIYVILRKSLLSRLRRLCQNCHPCEDLDLDYTRPPRKPLTQYPRIQMRAAQGRGRPNNYVHVRNQLCPSSQFVGQQNEAGSLAEGQRNKSNSSSSSKGSRNQRGTSQGSYSMCSVCRARMRMERMEGAGQDGLTSSNPSYSSHQRSQDCSHVTSPVCSAACNGALEQANEPLFLFTEDSNARYFCRLPTSGIPYCPDDPEDQSYISSTSRRRESGRGRMAPAANVHSYVSEADDHGYASKVSTDSSRMSTPERPQPAYASPAHGADSAVPQAEKRVEELVAKCAAERAEERDEERTTERAQERAPKPLPGGKAQGSHTSKQKGMEHGSCGGDSVGVTSGVFDSRDDDDGERGDLSGGEHDVIGVGHEQGGLMETGQGWGRGSTSRTLSCSSGGTHTESSSSHDRSTVIHRQLSSSSRH